MTVNDTFDDDNIDEITDEMWEKAQSAHEALPRIFGKKNAEKLMKGDFKLKKVGRPHKDKPKIPTTIRLDADVIEEFRSHGKGWQTEINGVLRNWLENHTNP